MEHAQHPVVVYGASGYTGRLTCLALGSLGVPFVAAGRNQGRLDRLARELRAGGADCVARVVDHTPVGLRELLREARVVVNITGPFSLLGRAVVEAALHEGCHYVDSTGEQDFMLELRSDFGARFEQAGLVLAPSAAFLWGVGSAAAELCLETAGVTDLLAVYAPPPLQTVASLQSMLRSARRPAFGLRNRQLELLPAAEVRHVDIPGAGGPRRGVVVGGGETTFFMADPRVGACETVFATDELVRATPIMRGWARLAHWLPGDTLDRWSDALVLLLKRDPPPERPETGRFVVVVRGEGPRCATRVVVTGTSPYDLTGHLAALAASRLLAGSPLRVGYVSLAQAFGAHEVFEALRPVGVSVTRDGTGVPAPTPAGSSPAGPGAEVRA